MTPEECKEARGMANDLISRRALREEVKKTVPYVEQERILDIIDDAQTIHHPNCDTCEDKTKQYELGFEDGFLTGKERPQGEWITHKVAFHLTCSFCGCNLRAIKRDVFEGDYDYNFCPNCGAKMGGEEL